MASPKKQKSKSTRIVLSPDAPTAKILEVLLGVKNPDDVKIILERAHFLWNNSRLIIYKRL